jgi:hypothetical protein
MINTRIPISIWIDAHLRRLNEIGQGYYIVNKGAFDGGGFVLKISLLNGFCNVLTQIRDENGELGWMSATKDETIAETDADAYIHRAVGRDPDIWVIEIEDRGGQNPFKGKVIL